MLVSLLDRLEVLLELFDVLLFSHLHLSQDLLLRRQLTVEVLGPGDCIVDLVLEFEVLLLENLDLTVGRVELDLIVFECKHLVFKFGASLEQPRTCVRVVFLLLFVALDPELSRLLLIRDDLVQALDLVVQLALGELERFLYAHFLGFQRRVYVQLLVVALVELFNLRLPFVKKILFQLDYFAQTLVAGMFILQLCLDLMPGLVHRVKLFNEVIVIRTRLVQLLFHLVVIDLHSAKLEFEFVGLELGEFELALQILDLVLTLPVDLVEADHVSLVALELGRRTLQVFHQRLRLRLVYLQQLLALLQLKRQVFLLAPQTIAC